MTTEEDHISRAARIIHEDACIDCDPDRPVRCVDAARSLADAGMLVTDETINAAIKDRAAHALKAMNSNPDHLRDQVRALSRRYDEETR